MGREQLTGGAEVTGGGGPDGVAQAHAKMLADKTLQFDFPEIARPRPPAWAESFAEFLQAIAPILGYLFWAALALVVIVILVLIARSIIARQGGGKPPPKPGRMPTYDLRPTAEQARVLLADADALAAQGQFAEAAHLLLLRGVQDIRDRLPGRVQPSLTSRDIAALPELPDAASAAFAAIAAVVERSLFGGRDVAADDWGLCRRTYESFAFRGVGA